VMGRLRAGLAALAATDTDPGRLLVALGDFAQGAGGANFATACLVVVDPRTGAVEYAMAGHPPPLVVEPGSAPRWLDEARSMPLCGVSRPHRPTARDRLRPGATVILYSDGLIERRGVPLDRGLDALAHAVPRSSSLPVDVLCDQLIADLTADSPSHDDIVVLAARYDPRGITTAPDRGSLPAATRRPPA
jgi:serine phosphatase RsbU (regulator of sigma subunit)